MTVPGLVRAGGWAAALFQCTNLVSRLGHKIRKAPSFAARSPLSVSSALMIHPLSESHIANFFHFFGLGESLVAAETRTL